jgi:hypothetical protein
MRVILLPRLVWVRPRQLRVEDWLLLRRHLWLQGVILVVAWIVSHALRLGTTMVPLDQGLVLPIQRVGTTPTVMVVERKYWSLLN